MRYSATIRLGITLLVTLLLCEMGVRVLSGDLPDWRGWPSIESEIKVAQMEVAEAPIDIVFLGSSVSEAAVDPDILEGLIDLSAYNASLPFSSPLSNEYWLDELVVPLLSPKVVVIGLPMWSLRSTVSDDRLLTGLAESMTRTRSVSELLTRRSQLRDWSETQGVMRGLNSRFWTDAGHQTGYYDGTITALSAVGDRFDGQIGSYSEDNFSALERMVSNLTDSGVAVVLVIEPGLCPPSLGQCPDSRAEATNTQLHQVAAGLGVPVIDAFGVDWDTELFSDTVHFNRAGTDAYTRFIAAELSFILEEIDLGR